MPNVVTIIIRPPPVIMNLKLISPFPFGFLLHTTEQQENTAIVIKTNGLLLHIVHGNLHTFSTFLS